MSKPGFYFLVCPDSELIRARVDALSGEFGMAGAKRIVFWGDEELPGEFWNEFSTMDLFGQAKTLVVRRAHKLKAADLKRLAKALARGGGSVLPFFCVENEWSKGKPSPPKMLTKQVFYKTAEKRGWVWTAPGLDQRTLPGFVKDWVARAGLKTEGNAVSRLAAVLPPDGRAAGLELDKIALAAAHDGVLRPEHADLVAPHFDMNLFDFMDVIVKGGSVAEVWKKVLSSHLERDGLLFPLVGYLGREARLYWMLSHGEAGKARMHPYVKKLKTPVAHGLGGLGVARLIDLALDAEFSVKTGQMSEDQALERLVSGLIGLFRGVRR